MPRSHPLILDISAKAKSDIAGILGFTEERFGPRQRTVYEQWLTKAMQRIVDDPDIGKATEKPPLKRYHMSWAGNRGVHCICYCISGNTLSIARVLHQNSDYNSILN